MTSEISVGDKFFHPSNPARVYTVKSFHTERFGKKRVRFCYIAGFCAMSVSDTKLLSDWIRA